MNTIYKFDSNGLRFSLEHLKLAFPEILVHNLVSQSEYVDYITFTRGGTDSNDEFIWNTIVNDYSKWNATTVGNVAYIALTTDKRLIKERCEKFLNECKEFYFKLKQ